MENAKNITQIIIETINTILQNLFSSIDNNLYEILDDIIFINPDIISDSFFEKILGTNSHNGIILICNSLLFGFILYYSIKYLFSHFNYNQIEKPSQFIFKIIIFGICINFSYGIPILFESNSFVLFDNLKLILHPPFFSNSYFFSDLIFIF